MILYLSCTTPNFLQLNFTKDTEFNSGYYREVWQTVQRVCYKEMPFVHFISILNKQVKGNML